MNRILALVFILIFASCSHSVHLVNMGDFSAGKPLSAGKWVSAEVQQKVIFWFVYDTEYVNEARSKLIAKCPTGEIQGVTTRYSTSHGFFHWYNKIYMQGLCLN